MFGRFQGRDLHGLMPLHMGPDLAAASMGAVPSPPAFPRVPLPPDAQPIEPGYKSANVERVEKSECLPLGECWDGLVSIKFTSDCPARAGRQELLDQGLALRAAASRFLYELKTSKHAAMRKKVSQLLAGGRDLKDCARELLGAVQAEDLETEANKDLNLPQLRDALTPIAKGDQVAEVKRARRLLSEVGGWQLAASEFLLAQFEERCKEVEREHIKVCEEGRRSTLAFANRPALTFV